MGHILEVEKPIIELENKIEELKRVNKEGSVDLEKEIKALERKAEKLKKNIFENLSPWDKVLIARHPNRPTTLDYIQNLFVEFTELHGDRLLGEDAAIIAGFAKFDGDVICIVGHQKGKDTKENLTRNFGMPNPEGLRKSMRIMKLAERFNIPVITFIDTPGAYPGIEAEERGQYEAIAQSIALMMSLKVPVIVVVIGEGGSGGALALGAGNRVYMLENSIYSVISPEGCASILWRDSTKAPQAAHSLKLTAQDLIGLEIIDKILPEPLGGTHREPEVVYANLKINLQEGLKELGVLSGEELVQDRYSRFRKMAVYKNGKVKNKGDKNV
ncbi:MAG: acetyl-CoA carboxylase carboxyltransferase subunit alpha [Armatimonadota bacterium]